LPKGIAYGGKKQAFVCTAKAKADKNHGKAKGDVNPFAAARVFFHGNHLFSGVKCKVVINS
jgi:hypothetical protein